MLAFFLQCIGYSQKFRLAEFPVRDQIGHSGFSACNRTGFIQCHNLCFPGRFQRRRRLEEDPVLGAHTVAYHNGNRRRQSQRTGAADNQYGDSSCQGKAYALSYQQPDQDGHCRNTDDRRDKYAGHLIRDLGDRRLRCRSVADHLDNLRKGRILSDPGRTAPQESGLIGCRSRYAVSFCLVHRYALTCQGRFIDRTASFQHNAVHGNILSRAHHKYITLLHLIDRNLNLCSVPKQYRRLRRELHQALQRVRRLAFGTCLQHFPYGDQCQDHGGRLKIELVHVSHDGFHIALYLRARHRKKRVNTIDK